MTCCLSTREEIRQFAEECKALNTQYVGLCCGGAPFHLRVLSDVYGKDCPALKYSPEMHKHFVFGDKDKHDDYYTSDVKSKLGGKKEFKTGQ